MPTCAMYSRGSNRGRSNPCLADVNDKNPHRTGTGATAHRLPRTMVEGLNAVVRDATRSSVRNDELGRRLAALAERQGGFNATATGPKWLATRQAPYTVREGKISVAMMPTTSVHHV